VNNSPSTEFTRSDGRRFAFPVGSAFLLLAAVLLWRDRDVLAAVGLGLGASLYAAGLIAPGSLGPVYRAWMGLARIISKVTTPIFMGIVYFGVLTPTGLIKRAFGKNPIVHTARDDSYWIKTEGQSSSGDLRRQF
jgi:hypothetical protein